MTDLLFARHAQHEALETRFGLRVASALHETGLHHDIEQRLRIGRDLALGRVRHARAAAAAAGVLRSGHSTLLLGGSPWWLRLASAAPLMVLALGLMLINRIDDQEQIHAAAEIDAVLLADELPPRAYSDPGFGEFLKLPTP